MSDFVDLNRGAARRLATLRKEARKEIRRRVRATRAAGSSEPAVRSHRAATWARRALAAAALLAAPFVLLVGTAGWSYRTGYLPTWLAMAAGGLVTMGLLTWYSAAISRALTGKLRLRFVATRIAAPLLLFYCGYCLVYLSSLNAKTERVRAYYTSVHPVLRLAISTLVLADREIVVTDAARVPGDYDRMGLPVYERSLHFEQPDGYVHAVDLRTMHRAAWRNGVMTAYFRLMGFRTLRHVGTADHLHVSLPLP